MGHAETQREARPIFGEMVSQLRPSDPKFSDRFAREPLEEMPEWADRSPAAQNGSAADPSAELFAREFDAKLEGKTSKLVDYSPNAPRIAAEAYRAVLGQTEAQCSDAEAIDRLLNPARNLYRLETLDVGVHAPAMRALQHANYTFAKKISHTADSQDQRHRMVPGSRPLLTLADTREPDYITPMLLANNPRAKKFTTAPCTTPGHQKTNFSTSASLPKSPFISSLTPNPSASTNPARSSISFTNGPCAPASTPRKKSTKPPWTSSPSSAKSIPDSPATSARPATFAPASPRPSAPKAPTSAASKSDSTSPTSPATSDYPRQRTQLVDN